MLRALLALAFALTAAAAQAQAPADNLADGRSGKIHFKSVTPTSGFNLVRGGTIPEAVVFGTLMLPQGTASLPAVVVAHGSGGVRYEREFTWARWLVAQGYAAFVVDSFTPRRISQTATDQSRLPTAANVADALAALKLLATHPRIDPARIAVIGFSKGGQVALYTSLEPYRAAVIKDPKLKFAAHIALYPYCNDWQISEHLTGAPVLMLLGGRDDYTPAKPLRTKLMDQISRLGFQQQRITMLGQQHRPGFRTTCGAKATQFTRRLLAPSIHSMAEPDSHKITGGLIHMVRQTSKP